jgi:hypothetical protein
MFLVQKIRDSTFHLVQVGEDELETSCCLLILKTRHTPNLKKKKKKVLGCGLATYAPKLIFKGPSKLADLFFLFF